MSTENTKQMELLIAGIVEHNISQEEWNWLKEKTILIREERVSNQLNLTFSAVARKIKKGFSEKKIPLP